MNSMSADISEYETRYPGSIPDLRSANILFVGSDYSGEHLGAHYHAISFIVADLQACGTWEHLRQEIRSRYLSDGRRISYKKLSDGKRKRALIPFLEAANHIPGIVITVLIDKKIKSLFSYPNYVDVQRKYPEHAYWNTYVFEKVLRVIHLCSFFLAGLSKTGQHVLWVTDEDSMVANEAKLRAFVKVFSIVASNYLEHTLGHIKIGSTMSDTGRRDLEDLVAIPDLVAGLLCDLIGSSGNQDMPVDYLSGEIFTLLPDKTGGFFPWLAEHSRSLKRFVYRIRAVENSDRLTGGYIRFQSVSEVMRDAGRVVANDPEA
jgi:hypothetical protein